MAGKSTSWAKIAVTGHSFVRRFKEFLESDEKLDLSLGLVGCDVKIIGEGGLTVPRLNSKMHGFLNGEGRGTELLVVMIGDNDVGRRDPRQIAMDILEFVTRCRGSFGVRKIVLMQLMPRYCRGRDFYNSIANQINSILEEESGTLQGVIFWRHDFVAFPEENAAKFSQNKDLYLKDGIHLTRRGYAKLYKSVRDAIMHIRD